MSKIDRLGSAATVALTISLALASTVGATLAKGNKDSFNKDKSEKTQSKDTGSNSPNDQGGGKNASSDSSKPKVKSKPAQTASPTGPKRDSSGSDDKGKNTHKDDGRRYSHPVVTGPPRGTSGATKTSTGSGPQQDISGVNIGPPATSGGGTVKTGTGSAGNSQPGAKPSVGPAAATDAAAATTDDPPARKRTAPSQDASAVAPSAGKAVESPAGKAGTDTKGAAGAGPAKVQALAAAPAAGAAAAATAAVYSHNNSTMKLVRDGDAVRLVYDKPRSGLDALGIKSGTPLFEGRKTGPDSYAGEATTFSRTCGAAKFPVAGESDGGVVTLRGQKPKRDGDCNVSGYTSETLVFEQK